jgi:hypothetical protein
VAFDANFIPHIEDLFFMQKQFPSAIWIVVKSACLFVRVNVGINQPGFLAIYMNIGLIDTDLVIAYRLNLGTLQDETCLVGIQYMEVKICLFVLADCFAAHGLILTQIGFQAFPQSIIIRVP